MTFALVFPGQGSQSVGMLRELAAVHTVVTDTFEEASSALDYDLWKLVQEGPDTALNMTEHTQPAMLAAGVAVWRVWNENGGATPVMMAGHSLGEYSALVCAGALDFADGIRLVAERARCMQAAVPAGEGAMAAVLGLDLPVLERICTQAADGETVTCANLNAPGQIVIAGDKAAVERAVAGARVAGAKRAVLLPVSVPSHCALMRSAATQFRSSLAGTSWQNPHIPVLQNADAAMLVGISVIVDALERQLHQPVRWIETVQQMRRSGVMKIVECGPGKVLVSLCKRIAADIECLSVYDPTSLTAALSATGDHSGQ